MNVKSSLQVLRTSLVLKVFPVFVSFTIYVRLSNGTPTASVPIDWVKDSSRAAKRTVPLRFAKLEN